jgi:hypothetical protein
MPMRVAEPDGRTNALKDVWLGRKEYFELMRYVSCLWMDGNDVCVCTLTA